MRRPLYVETLVRGDLDRLWTLTQDPDRHVRWDLRFTRITPTGPGTFEYALELPGRTVAGVGTSAGERQRPDGTRTSALRFGTDDPLSLLRRGSGYWRYVPVPGGIRFLTGYDYEPGWGRFGAVVDRYAFRPAIGWMTAWSFDRLRLWMERDQDPAVSTRRALADAIVRAALLAPAVIAVARVPGRTTARVSGRTTARVSAGTTVRTPARDSGRAWAGDPAGPGSPAGRRGAAAWVGVPRWVVVAAAAAVLVPAADSVPRAGRCLREPPDRGSARPPRSLDRLAAPELPAGVDRKGRP